ncbi:hypothetical protein OSSY52_05210 [Tepiditoga spiralis]|uniref:Type II secretion system protein GspF domain-containing protein n=1 Tax=Tepiditoga spiralis TaxID=2108365 RepID=A0A7G1G236_9BACT|nr:type II secretion system F family protein [Tepiditoga spiralis]BBE30380.1 hypothetical protein OSSY52_05210 [Tepiditoga spiralis]
MKKLYEVFVYDKLLKTSYKTYFIGKNDQEFFGFLSYDFKIINIKVVNLIFGSKVLSTSSMKFLTSNLYILLDSGVSLLDALSFVIMNNEVDSLLRGVLFKSYLILRKGSDLKTSFTFKEYDDYFIYSISICKNKSSFINVLKSLSNYYENVELTRSTLSKSTLYPFMVLTSILFLLTFLKLYFLPKISLLLNTTITFRFSTFMLVSFLFLNLSFFIIFILSKKNDIYVSKIPFLKNFYKNYLFYKFSRDINLLIHNGLSLYYAFNIVISNINSNYLALKFTNIAVMLESGFDIINAFSEIKDIPEFALAFSLTEKTGNSKELFNYLEKFFYQKFTLFVDKVYKLIEPFFLLILSIIVASLTYELYTNIFLNGVDLSEL